MDQCKEFFSLVPSLLSGCISHHFFATQNDLVQWNNPNEVHWIEYWFSVGVQFFSLTLRDIINYLINIRLGRRCLNLKNLQLLLESGLLLDPRCRESVGIKLSQHIAIFLYWHKPFFNVGHTGVIFLCTYTCYRKSWSLSVTI